MVYVDRQAQDIKDDELREFSYIAGNADEKKEMATLQVSSYLNLAACYQKTKDWANSFEACNYAISIDSSSGRAYFRRAQVVVIFTVFADLIMRLHLIADTLQRTKHHLTPLL